LHGSNESKCTVGCTHDAGWLKKAPSPIWFVATPVDRRAGAPDRANECPRRGTRPLLPRNLVPSRAIPTYYYLLYIKPGATASQRRLWMVVVLLLESNKSAPVPVTQVMCYNQL
jgi:hypothetical protein